MQALQNKEITIYGNGQQTRSFCYVDDMVTGMINMMDTDDKITGPINIGNPEEFTIHQLAETVIRMTGSKSKIVYHPLPSDDPLQRKPDISKARQLFGWEPKIKLEEGLMKTIEYFRNLL